VTLSKGGLCIVFWVDGYRLKGITLLPRPSVNDGGELDYYLLVFKKKI